MKNKRVLITGGLGFIGSNLAHRCVADGARVVIFDNLSPRSGGNLFNIHDIRESVELQCHDILDYDALVQHVQTADIIFNCAASTSHPHSMREPWIDLDVNCRAVVNLLEAVRRFNPEVRLVHLGTSTQLGRLHYQPADESHPEFPTDMYSANKCVAEKYVLIYAKAYGIHATVIRLANVFGPRAAIHNPEFTFNNYFIGLALQDRAISVFGEGQQLRNVLYVDDVVDVLVQAATSNVMDGETYFAVGKDHWSVAAIAEETVRQIGSGRVCHVPWPKERKDVDIGDAVLSNAKIRKVLPLWNPVCDLGAGLRQTRDYFATCLDKYLPGNQG